MPKYIEIRFNQAEVVRLMREMPDLGERYLTSAATEIVTDIQQSMREGTGRAYKRGKRIHRASAPGQPPAPDTGALRASIRFTRRSAEEYIVHDQVEYGIFLEFGTEHIAPRPFMRPAFRRFQRQRMLPLARQVFRR